MSALVYRDRDGRPIDGLPASIKTVQSHTVTGPEHLPAGNTGDIAMMIPNAGGFSKPYVRLDDGWHECGHLSVSTEFEDEENLTTWTGDPVIVKRISSATTTVTIEMMNPDPELIGILTGEVDELEQSGHVVLGTDGEGWRCGLCGSESMDRGVLTGFGCPGDML